MALAISGALSITATSMRTVPASSAHDIERKRGRQLIPFLGPDVKVITNGDDDAANHSGGHGTNRSGGRDRRDGPTRAHARAHGRL